MIVLEKTMKCIIQKTNDKKPLIQKIEQDDSDSESDKEGVSEEAIDREDGNGRCICYCSRSDDDI